MYTIDCKTVIKYIRQAYSHIKRQYPNFQQKQTTSITGYLLALFLVHRDSLEKRLSEGDTIVASHLADNIIWLTILLKHLG